MLCLVILIRSGNDRIFKEKLRLSRISKTSYHRLSDPWDFIIFDAKSGNVHESQPLANQDPQRVPKFLGIPHPKRELVT